MSESTVHLFGGPTAHLGRQAIFDRAQHVWAYELYYDHGATHKLDGDLAASDVILSAFAELGLGKVVGKRVAFITATRATITGDLPLPVAGHGVVLQFDTSRVEPSEAFLQAAERRKEEGFRLALDNFRHSSELLSLLRISDFIKVDFSNVTRDEQMSYFMLAASSGVELIAKNVDSLSSFDQLRQQGCQHFQGDFLLKPQVLERRRTPRNFAILAELMSMIRKDSVRFSEIEALIQRDAGLSVMLFRFLNSAAFNLRVEVTSIRQAVALLGLHEFGKWVTLLALASCHDKSSELLVTALVRAKTCEQTCRQIGSRDGGSLGFLVGLFSLLDAMLDQPLEEIVNELPLPELMKSALLSHAGPEGAVLAAVLNHERGGVSDDELTQLEHSEHLSLSADTITENWLYAVEWVEQVRGTLGR